LQYIVTGIRERLMVGVQLHEHEGDEESEHDLRAGARTHHRDDGGE
jgi:hypothetical protein